MEQTIKQYLAYFPIILVALQVAANSMFLLMPDLYYQSGFYLNLLLGTNGLFAIFLVLFTFRFRFCRLSRWAAVAECLFALNYAIVKEDSLYNILFQIIVGSIALLLTVKYLYNGIRAEN